MIRQYPLIPVEEKENDLLRICHDILVDENCKETAIVSLKMPLIPHPKIMGITDGPLFNEEELKNLRADFVEKIKICHTGDEKSKQWFRDRIIIIDKHLEGLK